MLVAIRVGGGKKAGEMTRVTRLRIKSRGPCQVGSSGSNSVVQFLGEYEVSRCIADGTPLFTDKSGAWGCRLSTLG